MNSKEDNSTRFPIVLHEILDFCEMSSHENIISWQPHGLSFKIHDPERFSETVLPLFFKHSKIKSFMRQLYYYNFHRITEGYDINCYYHEHFVRGGKPLSNKVIRKTRKVKLSKSTPNSGTTTTDSISIREIISCGDQEVEKIFDSHVVDREINDKNHSNYSDGNYLPLRGKETKMLHLHDSKLNTALSNILPCNETDELDLYAPNLRPTGIFMETPEDDLEFGLLIKLLSYDIGSQ